MREGWTTGPLASCCEIKPPKQEVRKRLASNDMVSFVPMNDLGVREKWLRPKEEKTFESVSGSYTYFADGDVLLANITPCFENGKLGIARGLTNGVGFGSSEFVVFRPRQSVDAEFLFYFLSQDSFLESGASVMSGAVGHKRVPKEFIERCPIPLPPLPEQKRIVAILDEAFAGIATAVANTEKNLANARELFESYLSAVFLKNTDAWTRRRLEQVCEKITVGHVGSMAQRYKPEGIPLLRSQNIRPFRVDLENVVYIDEEFHSELKKSALKPGDLGIVRTGYPGTAAVIPETLPISNCSDLVIVRPGDQVLSPFLALVFNSTFGKETVAGVLVGAAQKHFNVTAAKAALVPIPSREEQARVVIESSEVRQECEKLEALCQQKLTALAELKQSLLRKAFSGELTAAPREEIENALA